MPSRWKDELTLNHRRKILTVARQRHPRTNNRISFHQIRRIYHRQLIRLPHRPSRKDNHGLCWHRRRFGHRWRRRRRSFQSTHFINRNNITNVQAVYLFHSTFVVTCLTTLPRCPIFLDFVTLVKSTDLTKPLSKSLSHCPSFDRHLASIVLHWLAVMFRSDIYKLEFVANFVFQAIGCRHCQFLLFISVSSVSVTTRLCCKSRLIGEFRSIVLVDFLSNQMEFLAKMCFWNLYSKTVVEMRLLFGYWPYFYRIVL